MVHVSFQLGLFCMFGVARVTLVFDILTPSSGILRTQLDSDSSLQGFSHDHSTYTDGSISLISVIVGRTQCNAPSNYGNERCADPGPVYKNTLTTSVTIIIHVSIQLLQITIKKGPIHKSKCLALSWLVAANLFGYLATCCRVGHSQG